MKRNNLLYFCLIIVFLSACANMGVGPQGGPKDAEPPKVLKEVPTNGATNCHNRTIEVVFDEYIQLSDVASNVLISPPQQEQPEINAVGKRLKVNLFDALKDSTTYSIDFGDAIKDNNEGNTLHGYSFAFSTGPTIDSLQISGVVINAENLSPMAGVCVGIHADLQDSALEKIPFCRVTRTNNKGEFCLRNIQEGTYILYALDDVSKDNIYQTGEGLALYEPEVESSLQYQSMPLTPSCQVQTKADTIWKDSVTVDSITYQTKTIFSPSNIVLRYFKEVRQRHYFVRALREKAHYFRLLFSAPQDSLPILAPIGENWMQYVQCQPNATLDTITYWLTDSAAIAIDTLVFSMTYLKSDSIYHLQPQTDTIHVVYRHPQLSEKVRARMEKNKKQTFVDVRHNISAPFEIYNPITLRFSTPIRSLSMNGLHLYTKVDTSQIPIPFDLTKADSAGMVYTVDYDWNLETVYCFVMDSGAVEDIYGNINEKLKADMKVRAADEYATLIVQLENFNPKAVIQLLDEQEHIVRQHQAESDGTAFEYLTPKSYFLRLFIDENADEQWTPGDWLQKRLPERMYYFPKKITLRANWDFEEKWDYLSLPLLKQKPQSLLKNDAHKK